MSISQLDGSAGGRSNSGVPKDRRGSTRGHKLLPFLVLWIPCWEITRTSSCALAFGSINYLCHPIQIRRINGSTHHTALETHTIDINHEARAKQNINTSSADAPATPVNAWDELNRRIAICLQKTDLTPKKELTGFEGTSTGWAQWVDERSSMELQTKVLDSLELQLTDSGLGSSFKRPWLKWMQGNPEPYVWDISLPLRQAVENHILLNPISEQTQLENGHLDDLLERVSCRVISLPSGQTLSHPLDTPVGTMVYGKVLFGGAERFRLMGSNPQRMRKIGQRTQVANANGNQQLGSTQHKDKGDQRNPCWLQYGGSKRSYQALDMGQCLIFELALQPSRTEMAMLGASTNPSTQHATVLSDYNEMSSLVPAEDEATTSMLGELFLLASNVTQSENETIHNVALETSDMRSNLHLSLGGLRSQINEIVRRVLDGRTFLPYDIASENAEDGASSQSAASLVKRQQAEMETLMELGIKPVRGLLLYGPPGCGKTLLAREISRMIKARPPKIVAAPDLLDRWVGGTEKLVRELFADAEAELQICQNDPTLSSLHVVVIDECDALFRIRSSSDASSEVTRASSVNQILSKLDGVKPLDNILLIAMTNRRELLDPALLRPGRLEVQIECPLPDAEGRREILQIQLDGLRQANRLSRPLLESIYGDRLSASSTKRRRVQGLFYDIHSRLRRAHSASPPSYDRPLDLASDEYTKGFSGADLAGLVRNAGSLAMARWRHQEHGPDQMPAIENNGGVGRARRSVLDGLMITLSDFMEALVEHKKSRIS